MDVFYRTLPQRKKSGYRSVDTREACFTSDAVSERPFSYAQHDLTTLTTLSMASLPDDVRNLLTMIRSTGIPSPKLLAIGCGVCTSRRALELAGLSCEYYGCDNDEHALTVAHTFFSNHETIAYGNATSLEFADGFFDISIIEGSLQYIRQYERALDEAIRVTKSYLIITLATMTHGLEDLYYHRTGEGIHGTLPEIHISEERLLSMLAHHHMGVVGIHTISSRVIRGGVICFLKSYFCRKYSSLSERRSPGYGSN